jgi:transcriptional regulator of acetoin/glycerol metabolism
MLKSRDSPQLANGRCRRFFPEGGTLPISIKIDSRYSPEFELPLTGTAATRPVTPAELAAVGRLMLRLPDGRDVRVDRDLTVGQSSRNDVVIRDDRISRRHCALEIGERRLIVRDLGSTNGTFVNGLKVALAELTGGATLSLGGSQLRVMPEPIGQPLLVGQSRAMAELRAHIATLAATELTVLIHGETGTGKELVARALHVESRRRGELVALNCGSIARELIESELFGHERGAFTGALGRRVGLFQAAHGGTLFLDEIGELPLELQPRLLRALESGVVRPVGANREIEVSVRVVAATHVDLQAAVRAGRFREDLYYRLAGAILTTPPLRARPEDIAPLARKILDERDGPRCALSDDALARLCAHAWPGNVRELRNVLMRAAAFGGPCLTAADLRLDAAPSPLRVVRTLEELDSVRIDGRAYLEIERDVLAKAIQRANGNKRAAAQALQIPKSTLCDKAKRYGIGE